MISWKDHKANEFVKGAIKARVGMGRLTRTTDGAVRRRKLGWRGSATSLVTNAWPKWCCWEH